MLLIGACVLISNPREFDARLFAAVAASAACYLLGRLSYAVPVAVQIHFWFWPVLLIFMNMASGFWMILAYSLFQDRRRIPAWMIAAFAIQFLLSATNSLGYWGRDSSVFESPAYPAFINAVFGPLPLAMQSAFAVLALYWAVHGWRADLDEGRRVLRGVFLVAVGGLIFGTSAAELYLAGLPQSIRGPVDNAVTIVLALGYAVVALSALRFDGRVLERLAQRVLYTPDAETAVAERDMAVLTRALREEKAYLVPGLTIGALAKRLAMPEYRLRVLINRRLGYRNFNALLHEYRLRDACEQFADPTKAHLPILTIALDVGYQSITPFNLAFREAMGCTPSEYRRRRKKPS